jgi:hypothetical protein
MAARTVSVDALVAWSLTGLRAGEQEKADAERLLREALPFAERMLVTHGGFYPYGSALTRDGTVVPVTAEPGEDPDAPDQLIERLHEAQRAVAPRHRAAATLFDATIAGDNEPAGSDAIAVELDHVDGLACALYLVYRLAGDRVVFETVSSRARAANIFGRTVAGNPRQGE